MVFRETAIEPLPGLAAIRGAKDGRPALDAGPWPDRLSIHRQDPGGLVVTWVHHHGKADAPDFPRHRLADALPDLGGAVQPIDATMVLLIKPVRVAGTQ